MSDLPQIRVDKRGDLYAYWPKKKKRISLRKAKAILKSSALGKEIDARRLRNPDGTYTTINVSYSAKHRDKDDTKRTKYRRKVGLVSTHLSDTTNEEVRQFLDSRREERSYYDVRIINEKDVDVILETDPAFTEREDVLK